MTLQEIIQILGGVGVVASIVYVAVQIRNNARAVRAATYQQLSSGIIRAWIDLASNGELCSMVLRGGDDFASLDRWEKARFRFLLMAYLRDFQNGWFQHRIGTLKEGDWNGITGDMNALFSMPGMRTAWPLVKDRSHPEFQKFVGNLIERCAADAARRAVGTKSGEQPTRSIKKRKAHSN